ncbi:hypothetical protein OQA88_5073 [Cercophora sp. LCS_1]
MAGVEVIGIVLGLYLVVSDLIDTYKRVKSGDSARLGRDFMTTSLLYESTIKELVASAVTPAEMRRLIPSDYRIDQRGRLGRLRAKLRLKIAGAEGSQLQQRVKKVQSMNAHLRELLNDQPFITSHQQFSDKNGNAEDFQVEYQQARDFFEAVKKQYICSCANAHDIGLGCRCTTCEEPFVKGLSLRLPKQWEFCLALPTQKETGPGASETLMLEAIPGDGEGIDSVNNLCSLVQNYSEESNIKQVLLNISEGRQMFRMKTMKIGLPGSRQPGIRPFAKLGEHGSGVTSIRNKLEIAIRLSLAIMRLSATPWIGESWTRNDICVAQTHSGRGNKESSAIFIMQKMYSITHRTTGTSAVVVAGDQSLVDLDQHLDEEPVLTNLGLALTELALGRSIEDMRQEHGRQDRPDYWTNVLLAKMVLRSGRIRKEAGINYERAVRLCIERSFLDKNGEGKALLSADKAFATCFRDMILTPLFESWERITQV